jgi:phosphate transport system substrate-binding protein
MRVKVWKSNISWRWMIFFSWMLIFSACKSYKEKKSELPDTPNRGTIYVSADESFKPIIDAQVQVYEANHDSARIVVTYKPEAECLKDFGVDSVRMIIATRPFSSSEKNFIVDSMRVAPEYMVVARDAVAVIVNPSSPDSLFTMDDLRKIITRTFKKKLIPVFDGVQATSTVRFIVDSVLKSDSLTLQAFAAKTSEGVIDYVSSHTDAVGFIGVSWIGNKDDPDQKSFLKKVKLAKIESTIEAGKFVIPVQMNIYTKEYPMVRDLVYILKEKHTGLGHGFADFLSGDIGQLIFRRAYLVSAKKNFIIRPVLLRE